jgi:hypothetical protein
MKKLLLYLILPLLVIILAVFLFLGRYTDRVIDPYVRSLLETTRPMGHRIEYKKIRVNLFKGDIIIKDAKIFPDTSLNEQRVKMEIECSLIRLTEFSIWKMVKDKSLVIGDLEIDDPNVKITLPRITEDAVNEVKVRQAPKERKELLNEIFLNRIIISGGLLEVFRNDTLLASTEDINFEAKSIDLNRNDKQEAIGYSFGDVLVSLRKIDIFGETGLYDMELGFFEASKKDSSLILEDFKMIPKYNKKEFSKKLKYQSDRFDLDIGRIVIAGVGLERWLAGEPLMISKVQIDSLDADIYRDKNVAFNFNRFPPFYNESFLKIPIPVVIDTLLISNSKILYGELAEGRPVAGTILLEKLNIQSYDLTNQVAEDTIDHVMHLNVQALVMGEGALNVELVLPLEGNLHDFECSGSVGAMQLSPLNDMLEPSINMKFNGGKVNRMTFSFTATDRSSIGWMEFLYSDLDVALLKKGEEKEKGFISNVANTMTLSNNPAPGKNLKIVEIGHEHDKNKGIINYVWKTIQSGMIHTILPIKKYQINRKKDTKEQGQEKEGRESKKKDKKKK